jgi:nitroreductase
MAVAHLQLAATALGYGSCFASSPAEFAREELEAVLGVEQPWFLDTQASTERKGLATRW